MPCIEIIRIRLAAGSTKRFESIVAQLSGESEADPQIYQNAAVKSDYSIHLTHDAPRPGADESALHLVSALKEIGLVNHSVWVSVNRVQDKAKGDYND